MLIIRHIENAIILVEMFSILSHAYSSLQYDKVISSNLCTLNTFESASTCFENRESALFLSSCLILNDSNYYSNYGKLFYCSYSPEQ